MIGPGLRATVLGACLLDLVACASSGLPGPGLDQDELWRARRGITLLRDRWNLLPLAVEDSTFVLQVRHVDRGRYGDQFRQRLSPRLSGLGEVFPEHPDPRVLRQAASQPRVLLVLPAFRGQAAVAPGLIDLVRDHDGVLVLAFGDDPTVLQRFPNASTLLWADWDQLSAERVTAVADALIGRTAITGRLAHSIPGLATAGDGESRFGVLRRGAPVLHGKPVGLPQRITRLLQAKVRDKAFPGAVAMVTRSGEVLAEVAVGTHTYQAGSAPVTSSTRYDLASLTKVCATLPALAVLLERGVLNLDDPVVRWLPEFAGPDKSAITLRHLAVHAAGLQSWMPFYKTLNGKAAVLRAAAVQPLATPPVQQYKYSDLGPVLLMGVIERAGKISLEDLLYRAVYPSLGVHAVFARSGHPIEAAPTEIDVWRGRTVLGEVHDENAYAMGGVSGHAGLFGTAEDVARIGNAFLGGGGGLWRASTVRGLVRRGGVVEGSSRAILWDTFEAGGSGGSKLSERAFGHTGFTGTSVWCDPATDLCMVLLTNRVHPTRKNRKIVAVRRAFCDLVVDALETR